MNHYSLIDRYDEDLRDKLQKKLAKIKPGALFVMDNSQHLVIAHPFYIMDSTDREMGFVRCVVETWWLAKNTKYQFSWQGYSDTVYGARDLASRRMVADVFFYSFTECPTEEDSDLDF